MNRSEKTNGYNASVHRTAWFFAIVVFPLIWVGGLVTTYDAGMAVPDWPNTYGFNLFLYPIDSWFSGPWDLFVEHGHRLLASLAGLISIFMVAIVMAKDRRAWYRNLAWSALVLVVFQGILGGLRVVLDERLLAKLHGCIGPTFFMIVIALLVGSSKWWFAVRDQNHDWQAIRSARRLFWFAVVVLMLSWIQLVVGASLRHHSVDADPLALRSLLMTHLALAVTILVGALFVAGGCLKRDVRNKGFRAIGLGIVACVVMQIMLGLATWIVKFAWPAWMHGFYFAANYVVDEKSFSQMNIVTAHVAVGSLVLALLTVIVLRSGRMGQLGQGSATVVSTDLGVAT